MYNIIHRFKMLYELEFVVQCHNYMQIEGHIDLHMPINCNDEAMTYKICFLIDNT